MIKDALTALWEASDQVCGKRLKVRYAGTPPGELVADNSSLDTSLTRSVLHRLGVPDTDIDIFGSRLSNTYEEALALRGWAVGTGARVVIVPTEAIPSRRVHWVLQHVFAGTGILVLVPVDHSPEEAGVEWWKNEKLLITFRTELGRVVS